MSGGLALRRVTYLLAGGAIALGILGLMSAVLSLFVTDGELLAALLVLAVLPIATVGALPGVRELQVAGVKTLLGVEGAVVPEPMRWRHRWRTCLWTFLHLVVGFLTGAALLLAVVAAVSAVLLASGGNALLLNGFVDRPSTARAWLLLAVAALGCIGVAIGLIWLAGAAAAWAAPVLLGPVGSDRLALVEANLRREQEYRHLSRDLHDGVGHALSAISLQAEAGRRHLVGNPDRAGDALSTIGTLAGTATAELDLALSALRDGDAAPRHPERGLADLAALVAEHRAFGSVVIVDASDLAEVGVPEDLPRITSHCVYRVCAEGLTNAAKHGTGPVSLTIGRDDQQLRVVLRNSVPTRSRRGSGHGLDGLREQVDLLGGQLSAGPVEGGWVLRAALPMDRRSRTIEGEPR